MKRVILLAILAMILSSSALADDFMTSARGGGMGFSYFMLADDPSGAVYNPAGVGYIRGWQSYLMADFQDNYEYLNRNEDPYNGRFAIVYPFREVGAFAVNLQQSGSLAKVTGIPTVNHGVITYAREFMPGWSAGASFKYLYETMFGKRKAYDFDIGLTYRAPMGLIGSAAMENIIRAKMSPDYLGFEEYLPRRSRFGLGYTTTADSWRAAFLAAGQIEESGITEKYTTTLVNMGTEWWLLTGKPVSLGLRGGYTFGKGVSSDLKADYSGLSAGVSVNFRVGVNDLRLDYGIEPYPFEITDGSTQIDHYIGISYGWGGVPDYKISEEKYADDDFIIREEKTYQPPVKEKEYAPVIDEDTDFDSRSFLQYDVMMDVADISAVNFKRIVFYLRPQKIIMTNHWKLYIFRAKIKSWADEEIDRWALKVIEGKGVPPLNVVWDGVSRDGKLLPAGKYYYVLTATDPEGNSYATKWHMFKLE